MPLTSKLRQVMQATTTSYYNNYYNNNYNEHSTLQASIYPLPQQSFPSFYKPTKYTQKCLSNIVNTTKYAGHPLLPSQKSTFFILYIHCYPPTWHSHIIHLHSHITHLHQSHTYLISGFLAPIWNSWTKQV